MAKKCKYYINIHYLVNAPWESSGNFMFWKSLNFAEYCFHVVIVDVHTSCVACPCRDLDYCSKQGRGTSQHAIIATYHRSVKQWKVFIDLESIVFFPVQLGCYGYGSHCKVFCYACKVFCHANMNVTLFRVSANQISVFSITQQSR